MVWYTLEILCFLLPAQQPIVWEDSSLASLKPSTGGHLKCLRQRCVEQPLNTGHSIHGVLGWRKYVCLQLVLPDGAELCSLASRWWRVTDNLGFVGDACFA